MPESSLDPAKVHATLEQLQLRIDERFPGAGLGAVCRRLLALSARARTTLAEIAAPIRTLRAAIAALVALILAGLGVTVYRVAVPGEAPSFGEFVQVLEAGINDVVLISVGIFFLLSLERRLKRKKALAALHELRSIAHVVDMHQLTKDPAWLRGDLSDTPSSPRRTLGEAELVRYLDYCSEMLSLVGKIGALYVQRFDDEVVIASASEVEALTTGLSRKIWQKLVMLGRGPAA